MNALREQPISRSKVPYISRADQEPRIAETLGSESTASRLILKHCGSSARKVRTDDLEHIIGLIKTNLPGAELKTIALIIDTFVPKYASDISGIRNSDKYGVSRIKAKKNIIAEQAVRTYAEYFFNFLSDPMPNISEDELKKTMQRLHDGTLNDYAFIVPSRTS